MTPGQRTWSAGEQAGSAWQLLYSGAHAPREEEEARPEPRSPGALLVRPVEVGHRGCRLTQDVVAALDLAHAAHPLVVPVCVQRAKGVASCCLPSATLPQGPPRPDASAAGSRRVGGQRFGAARAGVPACWVARGALGLEARGSLLLAVAARPGRAPPPARGDPWVHPVSSRKRVRMTSVVTRHLRW